MKRRHGQRGQVFPIWTFGTLTMLSLLAFSVNYGNSLYWQLRAQNAADAAAQGAVSVQATHWNAMLSDLHAASIEEYRIRYLLRDLAMVSSSNGPADTSCTPSGTTSCATVYASLRGQFLAAANRYTQDVQLLDTLAQPTTANDLAAVRQAVANFQTNCAGNSGGDCGFSYSVINPGVRTTNLENVISDCCGLTVGGGLASPAGMNLSLRPIQIEVVACANVQPFFPSALSWVKAPAYVAIGRAAATTIMATQEFMETGAITNPLTGQPFQPVEYPESPGNAPTSGLNDASLRIEYGGNINSTNGNKGNPSVSDGNSGFVGTLGNQALDAYAGWWTAISMPPYSGLIGPSQYTCK